MGMAGRSRLMGEGGRGFVLERGGRGILGVRDEFGLCLGFGVGTMRIQMGWEVFCYAFILGGGTLPLALLVCGSHKRGYVWERATSRGGTARYGCIFLFMVHRKPWFGLYWVSYSIYNGIYRHCVPSFSVIVRVSKEPAKCYGL